MYKHYITIDTNGLVVDYFSSAFINPKENDILIKSNALRHIELSIYDESGNPKYLWNGNKLVKRKKVDIENSGVFKRKEIDNKIDRLLNLTDRKISLEKIIAYENISAEILQQIMLRLSKIDVSIREIIESTPGGN